MISSPIKLRRSARVAGRSAARYLVIRPSFPLLAGYQSECHCCSTFKASTTPASLSPLPVAPSQQHIRASPVLEASCNALGSRPSVKPAPGFPSRTLEEQLWAKGFKRVAGMVKLCDKVPTLPCTMAASIQTSTVISWSACPCHVDSASIQRLLGLTCYEVASIQPILVATAVDCSASQWCDRPKLQLS